jgi:hypothetical protein
MYVYFTTIENNMNTRNYLNCFCLFREGSWKASKLPQKTRVLSKSRYDMKLQQLELMMKLLSKPGQFDFSNHYNEF